MTTETELTEAELDQAVAAALGLVYLPDHGIGQSYVVGHMDEDVAFDHPATDVGQAIVLAVWLVDHRDWVIDIVLDPANTNVDCFVNGASGSAMSENPAEAICRSILAAAQKLEVHNGD
jgi:hypothetical protein